MKIVASLLLLCCCCCVGRRQFHFVAIFRFFGICLSGQGSEIGKAGSRGKWRDGDRPKMNVRNILMLHLTVVTLFGAGQLSVISAADFGKATKAGECSPHLSFSLSPVPLSLCFLSLHSCYILCCQTKLTLAFFSSISQFPFTFSASAQTELCQHRNLYLYNQ